MDNNEQQPATRDIVNERLAKIQDDMTAKFTHGESQRHQQAWLISRLSQEIVSMELEISQWRTAAMKHQTK